MLKLRGLLIERRRINQSVITTARITARAGRSTEIAMGGVIRVEVLVIVTIIVRGVREVKLFKRQDAEEQFVSRLTLTGAEKKKRTEYAEGRSDFVKDDRVPFNSDVRKCIQRKESGTLKLKAAVVEPTLEELEAYLAWRDGQRVPAVVEDTNIVVASVACVADNADVDLNHVNSNDTK